MRSPHQTTVEGHAENGKVTRLKVIPANRVKNVVLRQGSGQNHQF